MYTLLLNSSTIRIPVIDRECGRQKCHETILHYELVCVDSERDRGEDSCDCAERTYVMRRCFVDDDVHANHGDRGDAHASGDDCGDGDVTTTVTRQQ